MSVFVAVTLALPSEKLLHEARPTSSVAGLPSATSVVSRMSIDEFVPGCPDSHTPVPADPTARRAERRTVVFAAALSIAVLPVALTASRVASGRETAIAMCAVASTERTVAPLPETDTPVLFG